MGAKELSLVDLAQLPRSGIAEMFAEHMSDVMMDIRNREPPDMTTRTITVVVSVTPDEHERSAVHYDVQMSHKIPPHRSAQFAGRIRTKHNKATGATTATLVFNDQSPRDPDPDQLPIPGMGDADAK